MKKGHLFLFFVFLNLVIQSQDTLVFIDELTYDSDIEEELIKAYFEDEKSDYISLFLLSNPEISNEQISQITKRINNGFNTINTASFSKKSEAKQVKHIFKTVHKLFLHKYEMEADFHQIFDNGTYNCVTASVLYGILLKKLNIPFVVNQTPIHVYLIIYPKSHRLVLETTDPVSGYSAYSQNDKSKFINELLSRKLISQEEFQNQTINSLFDKYFFTDDSIGMDELIGIQYYNRAVLKFQDKEYTESYHLGEKSYMFFPMEETVNVMLASAAEILNKSNYDDKADVELLSKLMRFKNHSVEHNDLVNEYLRIINNQLINKGDILYFRKVSTYLIENTRDSLLEADIKFYYNYELARYFYNKGLYEKAFPLANNAVALRQKNIDAQTIFIYSLIQKIQKETDGDIIMNEFQSYDSTYNFLAYHELYSALKLQTYLTLMSQAFDTNNSVKGEEYRKMFETYYDLNNITNLDKKFIVNAYTSGAMYYFRKYNVTKSKMMLRKGLEYVPNNFDLETRLRQINSY